MVQPAKTGAHGDRSGSASPDELRQLGRRHPHTAGIRRFYFHPRLPVDVRHNAKIHRLRPGPMGRHPERHRAVGSDK